MPVCSCLYIHGDTVFHPTQQLVDSSILNAANVSTKHITQQSLYSGRIWIQHSIYNITQATDILSCCSSQNSLNIQFHSKFPIAFTPSSKPLRRSGKTTCSKISLYITCCRKSTTKEYTHYWTGIHYHFWFIDIISYNVSSVI